MKSINNKDIWVVNEGQTLIVSSQRCKASFCYGIKYNKEIYDICLSSDREYVKNQCKDLGYPLDFLYDKTDEGQVYLMQANSEIAICVEEVNTDGKFKLSLTHCKVENSDYSNTKRNSVQNENEMF